MVQFFRQSASILHNGKISKTNEKNPKYILNITKMNV